MSLDLSSNDLGDGGAEAVGGLLMTTTALTRLNLSWNQLRQRVRCHVPGGVCRVRAGLRESAFTGHVL